MNSSLCHSRNVSFPQLSVLLLWERLRQPGRKDWRHSCGAPCFVKGPSPQLSHRLKGAYSLWGKLGTINPKFLSLMVLSSGEEEYLFISDMGEEKKGAVVEKVHG